jgi:NAD+ kinase
MEAQKEQVIVVLKRSTWDQLNFNVADSSAAKRAQAVHQRHTKSVGIVIHDLNKLGYRVILVNGPEKDFKVTPSTKMVITVGGDGTLLSASHKVPAGIPVLGVNSDPKTSMGYLCAAHAEDVRSILLAKNFKSRIKGVTRLQVMIDNEVACSRVLNEALFSHICPAAMTKFILGKVRYGCSGLWVGTGAGSTGAMMSAGGTSYAPESKYLHAIIREPYKGSGETLTHFLEGKSFKLVSKVRDGILYLDGPFLKFPVEYEQRVDFRVSPEPLSLVLT